MTSTKKPLKQRVAAIGKLIGQKIRARRLELGMSQEALGRSVGVSFQQIQKYERGSNRISVPRIDQLATALQMNPSELMTTGKHEVTPYSEFLATKEGADIIKAMLLLNKLKRRIVIGVARKMSGGEEACR